MVVSACFNNELDYEILQDIDYYRPRSTSQQQDELTLQVPACNKRKLDLFLPKDEPTVVSKRPVIVFVPGGSWRRGDRRAYKHFLSIFDTNLLVALILAFYDFYWNVGKAFAKKGVACAVMSYRLSRPQQPWLLIELFCSLAMSITVVLFSLTSVAIFISLFITRNQFLWIYGLLGFDGTILDTFSLFVLISLDVVYFIVFWNACRQFIIYTRKKIFLLLSAFTMSLLFLAVFNLVLEASVAFMSIFFMLQMLSLFGAILYSPAICHPDHIWDISFGVKWVKDYGEHSKKFDAAKLFLCGHSAGGHLVSLLALDANFLEAVGMHHKDIKGVITISGVYNLHRLAGGILERLVLRPAFGNRPETWSKASPLFCLSQFEKNSQTADGSRKTVVKIPFLVLNAERDFQLLDDANEFVKELKHLNFDCIHYLIRGKNHFSVVTTFGDSRPQHFYDCEVSCGVVSCMDDMCLKFIRKFS